MFNPQKALVSAAEVLQAMTRKHDLVILDVTYGPEAQKKYSEQHISGARWVNLDKELSTIGPDPSHGGRHPLPSASDFCRTLGNWGLTPDHDVVIYDRKGGALAAARCWWMLRAIGHEKAWVINGGLDAALRIGISVDNVPPADTISTSYPERSWSWPIYSMTEIESILEDRKKVLIDVREAGRYRGEYEPIDLRAGHIPSAVNIPFDTSLNDDSTFRTTQELRSLYQNYVKDGVEAVFYCGSGVTACHGILAVYEAGLGQAALYAGSWSEWSRNPHNFEY
jgi:thiosulfate/3-mercaptopyruvate sulfurtransferase